MKKNGWLIFLVMVGLCILTACGSTEDTQGEANEEAESGSEEAATEGPFEIGVTQIVEHPSLDAAFEGFQKAIEDGGLDDVEYDVQIAQGDMSNSQTIATNFAGDNVDLIFANSTQSAQSSLNATSEIPILFTSVTDPVGADLVPSLEEAGSNITGTTDTHPEAVPNTVQFMEEEMDGINKVGMIYNSGEQNSVSQVNIVKEAMDGTSLEVVEASVSNSAEVQQAAESLVGRVDAFYIITDNTVVSALESVIGVSKDQDIPLFVGELDSVERGGFAGYGFDYYDIGYQTGEMAVSILKGEKDASEISPEVPSKLKLVINKQAAEEMGVELKEEWNDKAEFIE
ncbi:ABC transporter substrate-binding protein [Pontibacillus salicampi]|uniref:ABC transporter substrate-binding protein n=1 Tax=Pontibacillus salicampi TaxID=1449801 RepID=A0ABV6LK88_9BACI